MVNQAQLGYGLFIFNYFHLLIYKFEYLQTKTQEFKWWKFKFKNLESHQKKILASEWVLLARNIYSVFMSKRMTNMPKAWVLTRSNGGKD